MKSYEILWRSPPCGSWDPSTAARLGTEAPAFRLEPSHGDMAAAGDPRRSVGVMLLGASKRLVGNDSSRIGKGSSEDGL